MAPSYERTPTVAGIHPQATAVPGKTTKPPMLGIGGSGDGPAISPLGKWSL
jgi:hypothetical protein